MKNIFSVLPFLERRHRFRVSKCVLKLSLSMVLPNNDYFGSIFNNCSKMLVILSKLGFRQGKICHFKTLNRKNNNFFHLDSNLNFKKQISSLKSSCYHKLRNISKMQPHLSSKQLEILTISLVTSSLDYCNSLYYGINSLLLNQLQSIQNKACRVILDKKTHFNPHEEPTLA